MERSRLEKFLGFHEIKTGKFLKSVLSEFIGTAILIVSGCGSVIAMDEGRPLPTLTPALTFGMTVAMIVWTFNHASGAHINPCVSLSFLVSGQLSLAKFVAYSLAQCSGAIGGSGLLWYMVPPAWRGTLGSTVFVDGLEVWQGLLVEAVSTFFLLLGVFASSDSLRTDHQGSMPLTIGLIVFMQSAWAGKLTGCSMNPARTLGPALISGAWDHHWVYWAGPTVGAVSGALLYRHVFAETTPLAAHTLHVTQLSADVKETAVVVGQTSPQEKPDPLETYKPIRDNGQVNFGADLTFGDRTTNQE